MTNIFSLNTEVSVATQIGGKTKWRRGRIVGRTLAETRSYDVMLKDRTIVANISADQIKESKHG